MGKDWLALPRRPWAKKRMLTLVVVGVRESSLPSPKMCVSMPPMTRVLMSSALLSGIDMVASRL